MQKTTFKISKMDCPSEEQIIRMKLEGLANIKSLEFDIPNRILNVFHTGDDQEIFRQLDKLKFDTKIIKTVTIENFQQAENKQSERKVLWAVLIINFIFFAIESVAGLLSNSMGLVADSLDMLADSIVYGLALLAVGATMQQKKNVAKFTGFFQILLAIIGFIEVVRRFVGAEQIPNFKIMIIVSFLALAANIICLCLLLRNKSKEAHIRATVIFSSNDVIINAGVILAGTLVYFLNSSYPDLIVGAIVFMLVIFGAYKILQLAAK